MSTRPPLPPRTRQWSDLVTTDFASLDLGRAIAVLPLGATEQHGPHLPLSVDANLAHSMVQAATPHLPADLPVLFLPVQRIGYSPEHAAFAGTISLKADTVMRLWTDIAESVSASGVNKLVLFNTHGGNVGLMDVVGRELRTRLGMLVYSVSWFNLPLHGPDGEDILARFSPEERRFGVHAGQMETAMMLALKPRLVRQAGLGRARPEPRRRRRQRRRRQRGRRHGPAGRRRPRPGRSAEGNRPPAGGHAESRVARFARDARAGRAEGAEESFHFQFNA